MSLTSELQPVYLQLLPDGELDRRAARAEESLAHCTLCGHRCHADRASGARGTCRNGTRAVVSSYGPHHGEERPLSGWRGSGTIFFSNCNLHCCFCQNWEISQSGGGSEVEPDELAGIMLELQARGCHNVNLVSPTHVVPAILAAVVIAARRQLRLPLVYNSGGYDSLEALALLDGVVDVYMPDMKYGRARAGLEYSAAPDYPEINRAAVLEMHRQVGDLVLDAHGIARRGLLVRHLVLPGGVAGTATILQFLAERVSRDTYVNLMDQYKPCFHAHRRPPLDRRPTPREHVEATTLAHHLGLWRLDAEERER